MTDRKQEQYIEDHTTPENEVLHDLYRQTNLRTFYPRMLSGRVQGKFLEMICRMLQPERVLEIGTFTGYSAIAMAQGMPENGVVCTIEINGEMEPFIREYVAKAQMEKKIKLLMGDALQLIPEMDETFDLVFIDADKEQYIDYYELAMTKLRSGGFVLADNVLWSGKVLEDDAVSDKETMGIKTFNEHVKNDDRVEQVLLSIRDGLMLIRKI